MIHNRLYPSKVKTVWTFCNLVGLRGHLEKQIMEAECPNSQKQKVQLTL